VAIIYGDLNSGHNDSGFNSSYNGYNSGWVANGADPLTVEVGSGDDLRHLTDGALENSGHSDAVRMASNSGEPEVHLERRRTHGLSLPTHPNSPPLSHQEA
jgi:hypothetical protein